MNRIVAGLIFLFLCIVVGCASMSVRTVPDDAADADESGFRYYEAAPYVLVCTDNKGSLDSRLIYLPDLSKKRAVRVKNFLASSETTLTFKDGVLTSAAHTVDQTAIPVEIVKALEKVGLGAAGAREEATKPGDVNPVAAPYLLRVVCEKGEWGLVGCQGTDADGKPMVIKVTLGKVEPKGAKPRTTTP